MRTINMVNEGAGSAKSAVLKTIGVVGAGWIWTMSTLN